MIKIKQFSLKATLLTILAALTIGFTGCSDELSGDQTQGKPGYLTVNLRTLKTKEAKFTTDLSNDYKTLKDLNIFVFDDDNLLISKYVTDTTGGNTDYLNDLGNANSIDIRVNSLNVATVKVVAVANYGSRIEDITTLTQLKTKEVSTVKAFDQTKGLYMTGISGIATTDGGLTYTSAVNVSPIMSKINVSFQTFGDVNQYYDVTGIYIVNAVNKTKLHIIEANNAISAIPALTSKTVSTGYTGDSLRDYNFYNATVNIPHLANESSTGLTAEATYSYYVGENYFAPLPARGAGTLFADDAANDAANANTIILIRTTKKAGTPASVPAGDRWYTYALSNAITNNAYDYPYNNIDTWTDNTVGFSTKRKTNYNVAFTLNNIGTEQPFTITSLLTVTVTATGWEPATPTGPIF